MTIQFTDNIQMKISPIRVAWILDFEILDSKIVREVVSLNTRLWGGFQNVFIYSKEGLILDFWVNYLITYDPDIIVIYSENTDDQNMNRGSIKEVKHLLNPYRVFYWNSLKSNCELEDCSTYSLGMNIHLLEPYFSNENFGTAMRLNPDIDHPLHNPLIAFSGLYENYNDLTPIDYQQIVINPSISVIYPGNVGGHIKEDLYSTECTEKILTHIALTFTIKSSQWHKSFYSSNSLTKFNLVNLKSSLTSFKDPEEHELLFSSDAMNIIVFIGENDSCENFCMFWDLRRVYPNVIWFSLNFLKENYLTFIKILKDKYPEELKKHIYLASRELSEEKLSGLVDIFKKTESLLNEDTQKVADDISVLIHDQTPSMLVNHWYTKDSPITQTGTFIDNKLSLIPLSINDFLWKITKNSGLRSFVVEVTSPRLKSYYPEQKIPTKPYIKTPTNTQYRLANRNLRILYSDFYFPSKSPDYDENMPSLGSLRLDLRLPSIYDLLHNFLFFAKLEGYEKVSLSSAGRYSHVVQKLFGTDLDFYEYTTNLVSRVIFKVFITNSKTGKQVKEKDYDNCFFTYSELIRKTNFVVCEAERVEIIRKTDSINKIYEEIISIIKTSGKVQDFFLRKISEYRDLEDPMRELIRKIREYYLFIRAEPNKYTPDELISLLGEFLFDYQNCLNIGPTIREEDIPWIENGLRSSKSFSSNIPEFKKVLIQDLKIAIDNDDIILFLTRVLDAKQKYLGSKDVEEYFESLERYFKILISHLSIHRGIFEEDIQSDLKNLIEKGVIFQGFNLKCKTCLSEAWYPLEAISQTFTCSRCLNVAKVPFSHELSYKLHKSFFQLLLNNSYLTLWSTYMFSVLSSGDYINTLETKIDYVDKYFEKQAQVGEIDLFGIKNGKIFIAEIKKNTKEFVKKLGGWQNFLDKVRPSEFYLIFGMKNITDLLNNPTFTSFKNSLEKNQIELKIWTLQDLVPDERKLNVVNKIQF